MPCCSSVDETQSVARNDLLFLSMLTFCVVLFGVSGTNAACLLGLTNTSTCKYTYDRLQLNWPALKGIYTRYHI